MNKQITPTEILKASQVIAGKIIASSSLERQIYEQLAYQGAEWAIKELTPQWVATIPLTEMSGDHFSQIFTEGFAPAFMKSKIQGFNSLMGFHRAISDYGHFKSYRVAVELGYDVEFTLPTPSKQSEESEVKNG